MFFHLTIFPVVCMCTPVNIEFDWGEDENYGKGFLLQTFQAESAQHLWTKHLKGRRILLYYYEQFVRFLFGRDEQVLLEQYKKLYEACEKTSKRMSDYYIIAEIN